MNSPELLFSLTLTMQPVAKGRARAFQMKGKGGEVHISHYTPQQTRDWESQAAMLMRAAFRGKEPIRGPLKIIMRAALRRPMSMNRKKDPVGRIWHIRKPDLSNLQKSLEDALVTAKVIRDDSQIVVGSTMKCYVAKSENPHTYVALCRP